MIYHLFHKHAFNIFELHFIFENLLNYYLHVIHILLYHLP